jgi:hypothetical protein
MKRNGVLKTNLVDDIVVVAVPDHMAFDFYNRRTGKCIGWLSKFEVSDLGPKRTPEMILEAIATDLTEGKELETIRRTVPEMWIFEDIRFLLNPSHPFFELQAMGKSRAARC